MQTSCSFLSLSHVLGTATVQTEQQALVLNKHHLAITQATVIFWAWNDLGRFCLPTPSGRSLC